MNDEREIRKENNGLPRPRHGRAEGRHGLPLQLARQDALAALAEPERAAELALAGAGGAVPARSAAARHVLADARVWLGVLLIVGGGALASSTGRPSSRCATSRKPTPRS